MQVKTTARNHLTSYRVATLLERATDTLQGPENLQSQQLRWGGTSVPQNIETESLRYPAIPPPRI